MIKQMKRIRMSALVAGVLCVLTAVPAGAVSAPGLAGLGAAVTADLVQGALDNAVLHPEDAEPVGFNGLETRVAEGNPTIRVLKRQLAGLGNTDINGQFAGQELSADMQVSQARDELAKAQQKLEQATTDEEKAAAEAAIKAAQSAFGAAQSAVEAVEDAKEAAQQQLDDQHASMEKQVENVTQSLTVAAQSVYLGLVTLEQGMQTLDRNLAALDRNIAAVEKQVEIGMASQLTLDNLRQSRVSLVSQQETMEVQREQAQNQLAMLCGGDADSRMRITSVPGVSDTQLREMQYDEDLALALKNSYSVWVKQDAMRKASNDYEDNVTATVDYYEAAKLDLAAEKETVTSAFHKLYTDVQEKQRLLAEAQDAYAAEERNFQVDALQYERGMISKLDYLTAQDDLAAKQDAVATAKQDLFTAYNTYQWATRGYMASSAA